MTTLGLFTTLGPWEIGIILVIGLLLFGKRLPEVGRSLGRGIVEFKKGVKGIEDEIQHSASQPDTSSTNPPPQSLPATSAGQDQPSATPSEPVRESSGGSAN